MVMLSLTHKAVVSVFPSVTLYHVTVYMPVVCFCIGLGTLCLFLYHTYGPLFSNIVGILLATLPGSIERSTAGFGDRDAWCLMIGILAVVTYLASLQARRSRSRHLWTLASGITVFFGGLSWEGFGVFLSVILFLEVWRFLSSEIEEGLGRYILWVLIFVPLLYLASPAYRSGYGFAKHLAAFMLAAPVWLLILRGCRHLLLTKPPFADKLRPYARTLSFGLILASLTFALGYVFTHLDTFADTTVPLSQNRLMQSVSELKAPIFKHWIGRFGSIFVLGSLGAILITRNLWKRQGILFTSLLVLFTLTTFFRQPLDRLWGASFGNALLGIAIAGIATGLLLVAATRTAKTPHEFTYIAFIVWFLVWVALSRDARRYDFFIGVPLAFFTAELIQFFTNILNQRVEQRTPNPRLKTCIATFILAGIMFLPPILAHTYRSHRTAEIRKVKPGRGSLSETFDWMKAHLSANAVVAAHWRYGSQLNVLGGVKTITDQDHFIQHWIELYLQHVQFATSEREALEFLKTHNATHIMLTKKDSKNAFLRGQLSDAFVPIYSIDDFDEADVKVWEIDYPPDIQPHPKYLKTGIPEIDAQLQHQ